MAVASERLFVTWFTSAVDTQSHAVTDEEAARAFHDGADAEAVCGATVEPVPLTAPPGPHCVFCQRYVRARASMTGFDVRMETPQHRRRRPSWLRRLFTHRHPARPTPRCVPAGRGPSGGGAVADPELRQRRRIPTPDPTAPTAPTPRARGVHGGADRRGPIRD